MKLCAKGETIAGLTAGMRNGRMGWGGSVLTVVSVHRGRISTAVSMWGLSADGEGGGEVRWYVGGNDNDELSAF